MYKYLSSIALISSCLTVSAQAETPAMNQIDWGQYVGKVNFVETASQEQVASFSNVGSAYSIDSSGNKKQENIHLRVTVSGDGFTGASITEAHNGYQYPSQNNGVPNLGLVFNSQFSEKGVGYSVQLQFYILGTTSNGDSVEIDVGFSNASLGLYGIGVENVGNPKGGQYYHWQTGELVDRHYKGYRDAISDLYATSNGNEVDATGISTGSSLNAKAAANDPHNWNFINPNLDTSGIYYGTGDDDGNGNGNISAVYNGGVDTIGFTFQNSHEDDDSVKIGDNLLNQSFAIGELLFGGGMYTVVKTPSTPEPSTYALILGLGAAAVIFIRRRKAKA